MKKVFFVSAALATLSLSLIPSSAAAQIVVFNDAGAFNAAVGPTVLEDFSDANLAPGLSFTSTAGSVGGGKFNDRLVAGGFTTFQFANSQTAFGGVFDLSAGGAGTGILVSFLGGSSQVVGQIDRACVGCFFGFSSTNPFTSVTFTNGTQTGVAETFNLDNLQSAQVSAVPEPGTWAMMLIGFGAIGASMRRRRRSNGYASQIA